MLSEPSFMGRRGEADEVFDGLTLKLIIPSIGFILFIMINRIHRLAGRLVCAGTVLQCVASFVCVSPQGAST